MQIKVMTYNIHHGKGMDGKLDLDRIVQIIQASEADVIGLNEVDRHFSSRSAYLDQIDYLAKRLQMYQAFGAAFTLKYRRRKSQLDREYGNAILSRYPIVSEQNHLFDFYAGLIEGRALLETTIQIHPKLLLKIFVTHLSMNPLLHKRQTDYILDLAKKEPLPLIILGDWNMKPTARAWRKISELLVDVCTVTETAHSVLTFPAKNPTVQLDYIFVGPHIQVYSVKTVSLDPIASDHLPLIAQVSIDDTFIVHK